MGEEDEVVCLSEGPILSNGVEDIINIEEEGVTEKDGNKPVKENDCEEMKKKPKKKKMNSRKRKKKMQRDLQNTHVTIVEKLDVEDVADTRHTSFSGQTFNANSGGGQAEYSTQSLDMSREAEVVEQQQA